MKKVFLFLVAASISSLFVACTKEEEHHEPNSAVITITQPVLDDHIHHMDTLQVRGTIVSVENIHGYELTIKRTSDQSIVYSYEDHYHGMNKNLSLDWICDLDESSELEVTITATLDHDGNTTSESVIIQCQQ